MDNNIEPTADFEEVASDVFVWDRQFETGIPELDLQHRRLVKIINSLGRILAVEIEAKSLVTSLFSVFDELNEYVDYHFKFEETLMENYHCGCEHKSGHKHAHDNFIQQINNARESAKSHPVETTGKALTFLSQWLITHIVGTDMRMAKIIMADRKSVV